MSGEGGGGRAGGAPQRIAVGRVGRAHGLDGSFYVTRPLSRLLSLGAAVEVGGRPAEIVRRAGTDAHPIVRLAGVDDRGGAEGLRGAELTLQAQAAPALGEGEWWAHELEGCRVVDGEVELGTVARLIELPSCEALEVGRPGGEPVLVPLVADAVRSVRPQDKLIEIDLEFLDLAGGEGGATP